MSVIPASSIQANPLRNRTRWGLAVIAVVSILYATTLQTDINGSDSRYAEDVGEFQNALARWGTGHPTGYPLYTLSGAAFVSLLRLFGLSPAAAASAFSMATALLALWAAYLLLCRWRFAPPLAATVVLLLAAIFPFWIHATIAEVYALLMALLALALFAAARWRAERAVRDLYLLAFVIGLAVGHHRLAVLALPAVAILAGPAFVSSVRERPIRLLFAAAIFLVSLLVYLYLPFRVWTGSDWVYGDPGDWDGFWRLVTAREYSRLIQPAGDAAGVSLEHVIDTLAANLTWPLLIASVAGLIIGALRSASRWPAIALATLAVANVAFASMFPQAIFLPAALLPAMFALTLGMGFLAQSIAGERRVRQMLTGAALGAGAILMAAGNFDSVLAITRDPAGRQLIENIAGAQLEQAAGRPVVFALWGRDYFALAYAHSVTGELSAIEVVDHRANVKALIDAGHDLYTLPSTFYYDRRSLPWWDRRLGRAYLSGFTGDLVRVSDRPLLSESDLPPGALYVPVGETIALRAWEVEPVEAGRTWWLTLYWQAVGPIERDYSVFIHVTDRDRIDGPDAIIAQADSSAPVYGWYPTTRWSPGEIVRDDYLVQVSPARKAKQVSVGMYYQDATGAFHNLGEQYIPLP